MKKKYTRFRDIPQFTSGGSWQCDASPEYLIEFIEEQKKEAGLDLEPDFQRGHVWTEDQQVKWLEYFLRGGKSNLTIYLNCPSWNNAVEEGAYNDFVCVDGLQRYTAVKRFVEGKIKVFGSYYSEFSDPRLIRNTIKVNINDLKTKEEVLQWYIDMNTGGTPHTEGEISQVKWLLVKERLDAGDREFRERVTRKLLLSRPEIKKEDLCFFHDNSGYRYQLEHYPQSCLDGSRAFSVCLETSGKIKMFENLQAAVPKVRTFKNLDDFEENL